MKGFALLLAVVSSAAGVMGTLAAAEELYYLRDFSMTGWKIGTAWGLLGAAAYAAVLAGKVRRGEFVPWIGRRRRIRTDLLWAAAVGLFCSMGVHLTLWFNSNGGIHTVLHGLYWGLAGGIAVGLIARIILTSLLAESLTDQEPNEDNV